MLVELICAALIGYFSGTIPFGLLLARFAGLGDVRSIGSGNIGATNVLRTGSKFIAFLTLLGDIAKGFVPVVLATSLWAEAPHGMLAGVAALLGHMFPLWLKFKGGKGVATYIGVAFGVLPIVGLGFLIIWLLLAVSLRYSSLSAIGATLGAPVIAYFQGGQEFAIMFFLMSMLVIIRHQSNIERLINGEESKIGQK